MIKKVISWVWFCLLSIPAIMVFNDDYDKWYINLFGLLYCYLLYLKWGRLTTKWMRDYWDNLSKEPDEDYYE